jgi:3'-phosphoadenosine 5'-phosphosulfate sulfotransferase (PAPS reductase)/FAD synthetase
MLPFARLHAKTKEYRSRVDRARRIIDRAREACPTWYVAFSGGKDSSCVLHLVRSVAPDTTAVTSVRQWDLPETEELLAATPNLHRITYDGYTGKEWARRWESREQLMARHPDARWLAVDEIQSRGTKERGVFLGLRAEEAGYRKLHLRALGTLYDCEKTGKWHCNPIAWWSVRDVWAYIAENDVPYNRAYDVMQEMGIAADAQRIGPFDYALNAGALAILKRGWPEYFNRIAAQHPEARQYA